MNEKVQQCVDDAHRMKVVFFEDRFDIRQLIGDGVAGRVYQDENTK